MPSKIELTDDIAKWLTDHYGNITNGECAQHLNVGVSTVIKWARMLKLQRSCKGSGGADNVRGYCMDCSYYKAGGHCEKSKEYTGALNEKNCFKSR